MYLNKKSYKIIILTNYIKTNNLLFFISGLNKKLHFNLLKINNKILIQILKNSINCYFNCSFFNSLFFVNFNNNIILRKHFDNFLILKLNNKLFIFNKIKNLYSMNYYQNKQLLIQFCVLKFKINF